MSEENALAAIGSVNVPQAQDLYTHLWRASQVKRYCPILVWGEAGIGKSQSVKDTATKLGIGFKDLRLAFFEAPDLLGVPRLQEVYPCVFDFERGDSIGMGRRFTRAGLWNRIRDRYSDLLPEAIRDEPDRAVDYSIDAARQRGLGAKFSVKTVNSPPGWLPQPGTSGILFLDEINRSQRDTRSGVFQLLLDRRIGEYDLPQRWVIVAALNPPVGASDGGPGGYEVADITDKAFLSRFCHIALRPSVPEWLKYARRAGVDARIRAFVERGGPDVLGSNRPVEVPDPEPTPRSWTILSKVISEIPSGVPGVPPHELDPELVPIVAAGLVGIAATQVWIANRKMKDKIVTVEEIAADPQGALRRLLKFKNYPLRDPETGALVIDPDTGSPRTTFRKDLIEPTFENAEELVVAAHKQARETQDPADKERHMRLVIASFLMVQWGVTPWDQGGLGLEDVSLNYLRKWSQLGAAFMTSPFFAASPNALGSSQDPEKKVAQWEAIRKLAAEYGVDSTLIKQRMVELGQYAGRGVKTSAKK